MTGSNNEEYIKFRNGILVVFAVTLVCVAFIILLFGKGIGTPISKKMKSKESFIIYITSADCENCDKIKKFLGEKNVSYEEIYETSSQAKKIFKNYDFVVDESISPAVIYVKKGKIYSYLVNLNDTEELGEFIDYYKLSK